MMLCQQAVMQNMRQIGDSSSWSFFPEAAHLERRGMAALWGQWQGSVVLPGLNLLWWLIAILRSCSTRKATHPALSPFKFHAVVLILICDNKDFFTHSGNRFLIISLSLVPVTHTHKHTHTHTHTQMLFKNTVFCYCCSSLTQKNFILFMYTIGWV